jgi:hypothetical protein
MYFRWFNLDKYNTPNNSYFNIKVENNYKINVEWGLCGDQQTNKVNMKKNPTIQLFDIYVEKT